MSDTDARRTTAARPAAPFLLRSAIQQVLPEIDEDIAVLHLTLLHLGKIVESESTRLLADDGLETSDRYVLVSLLFAGAPYRMSPTQLAQTILQTTSGMSKTLRRLERNGLVERVPDPADARGRLVHLTHRGVRMAKRNLTTLVTHWTDRIGHLSPAERAQMTDAAWFLLQRLDPTFEPGEDRAGQS